MSKSEYSLAEGVEIVVYDRPGCTDCEAAENVIQKAKVPYRAVNIKEDEEGQKQVEKICASFERDPAVPVIVIHHKIPGVVEGEITFIEPRGLGLVALANTVKAFRVSASRT